MRAKKRMDISGIREWPWVWIFLAIVIISLIVVIALYPHQTWVWLLSWGNWINLPSLIKEEPWKAGPLAGIIGIGIVVVVILHFKIKGGF